MQVRQTDAGIDVIADDAGLRVFDQRSDRTHRDAAGIDTVHTTALFESKAIAHGILGYRVAVGIQLDDVMGLMREIACRIPLHIVAADCGRHVVDLFALRHTSLATDTQGRVEQHADRPLAPASRLGRACAVPPLAATAAPPSDALRKSRRFIASPPIQPSSDSDLSDLRPAIAVAPSAAPTAAPATAAVATVAELTPSRAVDRPEKRPSAVSDDLISDKTEQCLVEPGALFRATEAGMTDADRPDIAADIVELETRAVVVSLRPPYSRACTKHHPF